jgi:hypothetical protein
MARKRRTGAKWLASADPGPMLASLGRKAGNRKLRLFACACCRRIWHLLGDPRSREAVEVAERYADGLATRKELVAAHKATSFPGLQSSDWRRFAARWCADPGGPGPTAIRSTFNNARLAVREEDAEDADAAFRRESAAQADLLRCIVGNPFRPVPLLDAWRAPDAVSMARAIYESADFGPERMGVLADALEEAGCDHPEVLDHLRGPGPHARGCWVIDLLTGRG